MAEEANDQRSSAGSVVSRRSTDDSKQQAAEMALSVLAAPFLAWLAGARSLQEGLISLGEASEELFRRDRLPILHHPSSERTDDIEQQNEIEIKE